MAHQRYAPDHDACGVGFVTRLGAAPSHEMVERALTALLRASRIAAVWTPTGAVATAPDF